jgi:hypothetical protein
MYRFNIILAISFLLYEAIEGYDLNGQDKVGWRSDWLEIVFVGD